MTAEQISAILVRDSGHPEIVNDARNGDFSPHSDPRKHNALHFIDLGDKHCQTFLPNKGEIQRIEVEVDEGEYVVEIPNYRFVKAIYLPTGGRLVFASYDEIVAYFENVIPDIAVAIPSYWTHAPRPAGDPGSVWIAAPTNADITLTVEAAQYSDSITGASDETYWCSFRPDLVARAAHCCLVRDMEHNYRKAESMFAALNADLQRAYFDTIRDEVGELPPEEVRMRPW